MNVPQPAQESVFYGFRVPHGPIAWARDQRRGRHAGGRAGAAGRLDGEAEQLGAAGGLEGVEEHRLGGIEHDIDHRADFLAVEWAGGAGSGETRGDDESDSDDADSDDDAMAAAVAGIDREELWDRLEVAKP